MNWRSFLATPLIGGVLCVSPAVAVAEVVVDVGEARAVLALFDKRVSGEAATVEDWDRLWSSEGYQRLAARQESFGAEDYSAGFQEWVETANLESLEQLRAAVDTWESIGVSRAVRRALAYLPEGAKLGATIFPVLKRRQNSFVFEIDTNPAIFMYIDPLASAAEIENILTHELHHVGTAAACPETQDEGQSDEVREVLKWMGAFAEGLAMLTVAGDPDVHPHTGSDAKEWLIWERDIARFNEDLPAIESFLSGILAGELADEERRKEFFALINTDEVPQGAFYTVGWKMGALVERVRGREEVVASVCDMRRLLAAYNAIALEQPRSDGGSLATWSTEFLAAIGVHSAG